jgi:hypothetical protein
MHPGICLDNLLLSPSTTLTTLILQTGESLENRLLMMSIHKNTSLVTIWANNDYEMQQVINSILKRNRYLGCVHGMLGTRTADIAPTIPPSCGLWGAVLAKVGQGTQGASPVFAIFRNRLATWMEPV